MIVLSAEKEIAGSNPVQLFSMENNCLNACPQIMYFALLWFTRTSLSGLTHSPQELTSHLISM